jgi:hypothetical protein
LVVIAISISELAAQTTSSAAQVVTFGVRRIAVQMSTASFAANTFSQSSVKITAGSQSRFQSAVDFRTETSEQTISSGEHAVISGVSNPLPASVTRESNLNKSQLPPSKSLPPAKLIVTFTE